MQGGILEPEPFEDESGDGPYEDQGSDPDQQHFALRSGKKLGSFLFSLVEDYYTQLPMQPVWPRWNKAYNRYHGAGVVADSFDVEETGDDGEYTTVMVNQFRSIMRQTLTMTTKSRPDFQGRAINSDHPSLEQTHVAQGVLEFFMREKGVERRSRACVESGILFGEGFIVPTWDSSAGPMAPVMGEDGLPVVDPLTNQPQKAPVGDIRVEEFSPLDVVRDWRRKADDLDWYILRRPVNRYDLAALYPDQRDDILALDREQWNDVSGFYPTVRDDTDDVFLYEFFHGKTPAVENGRHVRFASPELVFYEGALPYDEVPVYRLAPADFLGSSFGYSEGWDLLGLQDVLDAMASTIVSNYKTYGHTNVAVDDGYELEHDELVGGMFVWKIPRDGMKPEGVQLTKMPDGILEFCNQVIAWMELLSGVNAVSRGNIDAMGKSMSGSALALIQAMAVEYNSGLQASYADMIANLGTGILNILKRYADSPRLVAIAGVDQQYAVRMFRGEDVSMVDRVVVDPGNPMLRNSAGRYELAQMIIHLQAETGLKFITSPEQLIQVLETGQLRTMTTGAAKELSQIKLENEILAKGPPVSVTNPTPQNGLPMPVQTVEAAPALRSDDHLLHIGEHKQVLNSPSARQNAAVVAAVTAHMEEHERLHIQEQARRAIMEAMFMAPGLGAPPAPQGNATPGGGGGGGKPAEMPPGPGSPESEQANQPRLPTNPMTGTQPDVAPPGGAGGPP